MMKKMIRYARRIRFAIGCGIFEFRYIMRTEALVGVDQVEPRHMANRIAPPQPGHGPLLSSSSSVTGQTWGNGNGG